jgi:hypothetical protein
MKDRMRLERMKKKGKKEEGGSSCGFRVYDE